MKELSIEEKAKAYDEAIKVANKYKDTHIMFPQIKDEIFPELAESEDERIRKALMQNLKERFGTKGNMGEGLDMPDVLAWLEKQGDKVNAIEGFETEFERQVSHLIASAINREHEYNEGYVKWIANALLNFAKHELEKQGEQKKSYDTCNSSMMDNKKSPYGEKRDFGYFEEKPTDKVEPKFKVGDWIINAQGTLRHIEIVDKGCYKTDGGYLSHDTYEKTFHLWTIQDAKDGDVLSYNDGHGNDCIELIKSAKDKKIEFWFCLTNGNRYEVFDGITPYTNLVSREDATPATKEQRELLFQKMKEAGYVWDAEKKELKKIEGESTWSEEDEKHLNRAINILDINKAYTTSPDRYEDTINWLKSIKDRYIPQPKQEWSEEEIENCAREAEDNNCIILAKHIRQLKFFRPQNWTKEDKERYISCLQRLGTGNPEQPETINSKWFKEHVYPQSHWKPNEEQINNK